MPPPNSIKTEELSDFYEDLLNHYPILSIEDPFAEDDWNAWVQFNQKFGKQLMIVGDDLFVTNSKRLENGIERKAANAILIKLNQVGTLSETLDVIKKAKEVGFKTIISHRSGETEDTSITHLAVGVSSQYIKTGYGGEDNEYSVQPDFVEKDVLEAAKRILLQERGN